MRTRGGLGGVRGWSIRCPLRICGINCIYMSEYRRRTVLSEYMKRKVRSESAGGIVFWNQLDYVVKPVAIAASNIAQATLFLILVLVRLVVHYVEEPQLVDALAGAHDAQPVAQLLLLEVLFRPVIERATNQPPPMSPAYSAELCKRNSQILQVPPGKLGVRDDLDLAVADLAYLHHVPQVAHAALDLDAIVQELLEGGDVEDLVRGGLGGVDYELDVVVSRLVYRSAVNPATIEGV